MCDYIVYTYMYTSIRLFSVTRSVYWDFRISWLVSSFNDISNFLGYLMFIEELQWYYLTHCCGNMEIYAFSKTICTKVKVRAWLEFELTDIDYEVQHLSYEAMDTLGL